MTDDQNLGDQNVSTAGPTAGGATRTGPPWEAGPASFNGFIATAKEVLLDPTAFFTRMRREGGLGGPLVYGLIGLSLGMIFSFVSQRFFSRFGIPGIPLEAREMVGGMIGLLLLVCFAPVLAIITLFLGSALYHVLLLLFGGSRFPYETTFRVVCYAAGSTSLVHIIPVCGGLIGAVWNIVVSIIGLARAHETTTGKAAAAVLVPIVICCAVLIFFIAAIVAMIVTGVRGAHSL